MLKTQRENTDTREKPRHQKRRARNQKIAIKNSTEYSSMRNYAPLVAVHFVVAAADDVEYDELRLEPFLMRGEVYTTFYCYANNVMCRLILLYCCVTQYCMR